MQGLQDILKTISSENASGRPKMAEALTLLREYRTSLSQETLSKWVAIFQEESPFEGDDGLLDACDVRTEQ